MNNEAYKEPDSVSYSAGFGEALSEIWNSNEYYDMMNARKKKEKQQRRISFATLAIAAAAIIAVSVFLIGTIPGRSNESLLLYHGFWGSDIVRAGDKYFLRYSGDKGPVYGESDGKKYYLGEYGQVDLERLDAFLEERDNAYRQVVAEYGDYSYTVHTGDAIITYYNDANMIKGLIEAKLSEESLEFVRANDNTVEVESFNGSLQTFCVLEGSGGDILFRPAVYPSDVVFYVAAGEVNRVLIKQQFTGSR